MERTPHSPSVSSQDGTTLLVYADMRSTMASSLPGFKLHHTAYAEQKARRDLERERERVLHSARK